MTCLPSYVVHHASVVCVVTVMIVSLCLRKTYKPFIYVNNISGVCDQNSEPFKVDDQAIIMFL